ncbi:hypothetical protein HDU93_006897, partial [Gonapodya sp. JEL0774]
YGPPARAHIHSSFPGRFHIEDGDSLMTVPWFQMANPDVKCDLIHVDGGHSYQMAYADLWMLRVMANRQRHVVLMDDLNCQTPSCEGPMRAWEEGKSQGWLRERSCYSFVNRTRGWCAGEYVF